MSDSYDSFYLTVMRSCFGNADKGDTVQRCQGVHIEKSRRWGLISVDIVNRAPGEVFWQGDLHRTIYPLTDIRGTTQSGNGETQSLRLKPGNFAFRPAGLALRSTLPEPARFVRIQQSPDTYERLSSEMARGGSIQLEPRSDLHDPLVSQIVSAIANEVQERFLDYIRVDALSTALAVQILRHHADPTAIALNPANGLSRDRLQRVRDHIETHLEDRLTLTNLAPVARLSSYHFSRSSKQSVGIGPQRYVMRLRVERAKTLVRGTRRPLAAIAQETGFADRAI
jgi:AraC family transcriptional regulator